MDESVVERSGEIATDLAARVGGPKEALRLMRVLAKGGVTDAERHPLQKLEEMKRYGLAAVSRTYRDRGSDRYGAYREHQITRLGQEVLAALSHPGGER